MGELQDGESMNEGRNMREDRERAIEQAFIEWDDDGDQHLFQGDHLIAERVPGFSCEHAWSSIVLSAPSVSKGAEGGDWRGFLQHLFDEMDLGDKQVMCTQCKSFALMDKDGKIWAYDASASLPPELPRKERTGGANKKQWRR
jgi:hypothetical protein